MKLKNEDMNDILYELNKKVAEDTDFAKIALENPIMAFDIISESNNSRVASFDKFTSHPLLKDKKPLTKEQLKEVLGS